MSTSPTSQNREPENAAGQDRLEQPVYVRARIEGMFGYQNSLCHVWLRSASKGYRVILPVDLATDLVLALNGSNGDGS